MRQLVAAAEAENFPLLAVELLGCGESINTIATQGLASTARTKALFRRLPPELYREIRRAQKSWRPGRDADADQKHEECRTKHREVVIGVLGEGLSGREYLSKRHPTSYLWLLDNDYAWLDQVLPVPKLGR